MMVQGRLIRQAEVAGPNIMTPESTPLTIKSVPTRVGAMRRPIILGICLAVARFGQASSYGLRALTRPILSAARRAMAVVAATVRLSFRPPHRTIIQL